MQSKKFGTSKMSMFITFFVLGVANAAGPGYYRAAVVDYELVKNESLSAEENLKTNLGHYDELIRAAQNETADIIVFPEGGLCGSMISFAVPDPSQKVVPANNPDYHEALQTLSGYAKNYSIYVAVNVLEDYKNPKSGAPKKYNTNVVFDRNGAVIARYRKFNLNGESLDRTWKPEHSYFDADFGVRVGQFIGSDILFQEPALTLLKNHNVTDFIHSSQWVSEFPFLTSVQTQWSWAVGNDVNLLSAGLNDVLKGKDGSGIYRGKNALNNLYVFYDKTGNMLLVGDVRIRGETSYDGLGSGKGEYKHQIYTGEETMRISQQNDLDQMTNENIEFNQCNFKKRLCHRSLCCTFDLKLPANTVPSNAVKYKAVIFDGTRRFSGIKSAKGVQFCGVILCLNADMSSCGAPVSNGVLPHYDTPLPQVTFSSIKIEGNFLSEGSNVLPNVLLWPRNPLLQNVPGDFLVNPREISFSSKDNAASLSLEPKGQIITAAIHSRVFARDTVEPW